jgi:hypothetical protein
LRGFRKKEIVDFKPIVSVTPAIKRIWRHIQLKWVSYTTSQIFSSSKSLVQKNKDMETHKTREAYISHCQKAFIKKEDDAEE